VGMGKELYSTSKHAKEVFDLVDESLSFSLSELMFQGPADELEKTVNSQPAIMTTSLASLAAFEEHGSEQQFPLLALAGHSLGEYTSLVAAGVVDLATGVGLVRERGRLMQEAADRQAGGMAAIIGLDHITLDEICGETGVEIANVNSDSQTVISGERIALARAMDLASARGARKTIPLAVAGAFHSQLMAPAQKGLRLALAKAMFSEPKAPIVANMTAKKLNTALEVKAELEQQLCSCVQWKNSVNCMIDMGVSTFMEFGAAQVLTSLVKKINRQVKVVNIGDVASAKKVVEQGAML